MVALCPFRHCAPFLVSVFKVRRVAPARFGLSGSVHQFTQWWTGCRLDTAFHNRVLLARVCQWLSPLDTLHCSTLADLCQELFSSPSEWLFLPALFLVWSGNGCTFSARLPPLDFCPLRATMCSCKVQSLLTFWIIQHKPTYVKAFSRKILFWRAKNNSGTYVLFIGPVSCWVKLSKQTQAAQQMFGYVLLFSNMDITKVLGL